MFTAVYVQIFCNQNQLPSVIPLGPEGIVNKKIECYKIETHGFLFFYFHLPA